MFKVGALNSTWLVAGMLLLGRSDGLAGDVDFARQVAPILSQHCARCHNATKARAGLNLTTRASALKGGDGGEVIVPGKPDESLLVQRAREGSMPPETDGRSLTPEEVKVLSNWVQAGLPWPEDYVITSPAVGRQSADQPRSRHGRFLRRRRH